MTTPGIHQAIAQAGSQTALAHVLGVSQAVVSTWAHRGWVPRQRAQQIETLYGIDRMQLLDPRLRDLLEND